MSSSVWVGTASCWCDVTEQRGRDVDDLCLVKCSIEVVHLLTKHLITGRTSSATTDNTTIKIILIIITFHWTMNPVPCTLYLYFHLSLPLTSCCRFDVEKKKQQCNGGKRQETKSARRDINTHTHAHRGFKFVSRTAPPRASAIGCKD